MKKRLLTLLLAATLTLGLLAGCGKTNTPEAEGEEQTESTKDKDSKKKDKDQQTTDQAKESPALDMLGHWKLMCNVYHSEYSDGDFYDSSTMFSDEYAPESEIIIRQEDGEFYADYYFSEYEFSEKMCGIKLTQIKGDGDTWSMVLEDPFEEDSDNQRSFELTLNEDGRLVATTDYAYTSDDPDYDYSFNSTSQYIYLPKDSPLFDDPESLRYFDTVTVSNTQDLLNSVQNNRKIILESGKYNFSEVAKKSVNNYRIDESWSGNLNTITEVYNLCLEAADGADVEFLIDEAYDPVFEVKNSHNITIRGITCGHNVEPGYCSGSVLYFDSTDGVNIDKCNLYGSGTYGIEADSTYSMNVTDTDIYECTYGLVSLRNSGSTYFKNCTMRDSSDLSMIYCYSVYDVLFEDCVFSGNDATAFESCYFVELGEYDRATFRNCAFNDNKFNAFSNREVTLENCTSNNNNSTMADLLNGSDDGVPDKNQLLESYNAAVERQEEIDNEITTNTLLDQATLNQLAYEEYDMWDVLLNQMWAYLGETLDEDNMNSLRDEQQKWIREKEASMKEAGADFEGGTMQPMIEYSSGATITRQRVEELIQRYIGD